MNIDSNVASPALTPVQKPGGGSVRQRAPDDAPGGASFLSLLQAQAIAAAEPAIAEADGAAQSGQAGAGVSIDDELAARDLTGDPHTVAALPAAVVPPAPTLPPQSGPTHAHARRGPGTDFAAAQPAMQADAAAAADGAVELADTDPAHAAALKAANAASGKAGVVPGEADAQARQQAAEALATARDNVGRAEPSAKESDAAQWRSLVASPAGNPAAAVGSMFEAGLAGLRGGPGARVHERGTARSLASEAPGLGFVAWSDAVPGSSAPQAANPVYAPTVAAAVLPAALAQKLHYWVAGGVQSAELQLDFFGGGAVDVRIAVKGDEAFVEFRSDQPQARKLLLDAMPHLKDLLAGEGLLLSGGFVGGSAQDTGSGAGGRRDRPLGVRAAQDQVQEVSAAPAAPPRMVSGKSVDLFV